MDCRYLHIVFILVCCLIAVSQCSMRKPLNGVLESRRLKSGPVFLVDSRTIVVTKFSYDNGKRKNALKIHNKWFKGVLRRGDNVTEYVDLEFANQTSAHLTANLYLAQNMYLHVPDASAFNVPHFSAVAVVNDKNEIKTAVTIEPEDIIDLPVVDHHSLYKNGKFVFVYPKCCPLDSYKQETSATSSFTCERGIENVSAIITRVPIHEERRGMVYNTVPLRVEHIAYEPFYAPMTCSLGMFDPADEDDHLVLLSNLELLIADISRPQLACLESSLEKDVLKEYVYICMEDMEDDEGVKKNKKSSASGTMIHSTVLMIFVIVFQLH